MAKYLSQEWRDNVSAGKRRSPRKPWTVYWGTIKDAADAGNRREAIRLLDKYIASRRQEAA